CWPPPTPIPATPTTCAPPSRPTLRWPGPPISPSRCTPWTRRTRTCCAPSTWLPPTSPRTWAGHPLEAPDDRCVPRVAPSTDTGHRCPVLSDFAVLGEFDLFG